jgi:pyrophosphate--fructose-6-phosphate 1-phosphotransferase
MLDLLRQNTPPQIPLLLQDLSKLSFSQEKEAARAQLGSSQPLKPLRIGTLFSGGPAPGGHNVVAGLLDAIPGSQIFGFLNGPKGLITGQAKEVTRTVIAPFRNQGGFDLLGTGRTKLEKEEDFKAAFEVSQKLALNGVVIIGGDDSNTNAADLAEYFQKRGSPICVIGVPKTIDGDLQNDHVAIPFGFDTATKTYAEVIGNIARDACSAKKYTHFVKLMGRTASHVTLECALATHPNLALISEERKPLHQLVTEIADLIEHRSKAGKEYGVILVPEGLVEFIPDLQKEAPHLTQDAHGNLNVSSLETELFLIQHVTAELKRRSFSGKFSPVRHFLGYEGRSGFPTHFDANYCYALGLTAALLIAHKFTGMMAFVAGLKEETAKWSVGGALFPSLMHMESRNGKIVRVIAKKLVDLQGKPYLTYQQHKADWALSDSYRYPGPIQFFGDPKLTHAPPFIL